MEKLTKENVYVQLDKDNIKKQAKYFRRVLEDLDENIDCSFMPTDFDHIHLYFELGTWCIGFCDKKIRTKITLKQLIELLVNQKKPLLTSEEGVDLYEGDEFWHVLGSPQELGRSNPIKVYSDSAESIKKCTHEDKAFTYKENAEKFIEEQKPKEIFLLQTDKPTKVTKDDFQPKKPFFIDLYTHSDIPSTVFKSRVELSYEKKFVNILGKNYVEFGENHKTVITGEELEQIYTAYKSLQ